MRVSRPSGRTRASNAYGQWRSQHPHDGPREDRYVDLCELCESRHQVGETLNTEHGWILVERIDDFLEILVDNFAPEASSRLRRPRRTGGCVKVLDSLEVVINRGLGVVAPLEFLQHCLSEIGHRHLLATHTLPGWRALLTRSVRRASGLVLKAIWLPSVAGADRNTLAD